MLVTEVVTNTMMAHAGAFEVASQNNVATIVVNLIGLHFSCLEVI